MTEDKRPVIAEIGGIRIVRGDGWWNGPGGAWAVRIMALVLLLTWIAGVITVIWTLVRMIGS